MHLTVLRGAVEIWSIYFSKIGSAAGGAPAGWLAVAPPALGLHTGIVCEHMHALGANLRKLAGQAKL
eukprot:scaffold91552_cov33-Phaeocystis_antarctica.AAC.1